jgi:inhibitor of growth (ING)-like protein/PHD finger protein
MGSINFEGLPIDSEAQSVITDFLDYTEYLPSDLFRSFTLIQTLDKQYHQHLDKIHELTTVYGRLPSIPEADRPNAVNLRRDISIYLDKAYMCRDDAYAEIQRLNESVRKHTTRLATIKTKLEALPKPPSRDPTPVPVSPIRRRKSDTTTIPKLKLNLGEKKRSRKSHPELTLDFAENAVDSDSNAEDGVVLKKTPKLKGLPKTPRPRGSIAGSNVHSAVAGISTSNALAKLTPPPADAPAGSRWRPWFKLTEYEMAKLRKQMKKNAVWTPSEAMIRRELIKDGRGRDNYERAKAEAEMKGEDFLDEEPDTSSKPVLPSGQLDRTTELLKADSVITNAGMKLNEAKKLKKDKAQEALRAESAAKESAGLETPDTVGPAETPDKLSQETPTPRKSRDKRQTRGESQRTFQLANKKMEEAVYAMRNLFNRDQPPLTPSVLSPQKEEPGRSTRKRKRNSEKENVAVEQTAAQETSPKQTSSKRQKVTTQKDTDDSTGGAAPPKSPVKTVTTTTTVPLAPEGPTSSPKAKEEEFTSSPTDVKRRGTTPTATAAFSRPRRISQAPAKFEDQHQQPAPPSDSVPPMQPTTPAPLPDRKRSTTPTPRTTRASRHASTMKAASAEPPTKKRELREQRRLSINTDTGSPAPRMPVAALRRSGRRAVPGLVMAEEDGKGKVSIGRRRAKPKGKAAGKKGEKEKKAEEVDAQSESEVDPNEERYCICGDVSYGTMIACDNTSVGILMRDGLMKYANHLVQCDKEWFHIKCMGMQVIPSSFRNSKWYCPECRAELNVDEKGNSLAPITISTRRRA